MNNCEHYRAAALPNPEEKIWAAETSEEWKTQGYHKIGSYHLILHLLGSPVLRV